MLTLKLAGGYHCCPIDELAEVQRGPAACPRSQSTVKGVGCTSVASVGYLINGA